MRVAYFTNQYPATSHTFIRREIHALEARGHRLFRYAIRPGAELVDPGDVFERSITDHVLSLGVIRLAASIAKGLMSQPLRSLRAARAAFRYASVSRRGHLVHLAYLAEAFVVANWCRRDRIEHLHVHFGTNPATVGALVHELTAIPFSFTVHGPEEFDRADEHGLGSKVAAASFVAAVSSFGRSQLMRWAGFEDWHKIHVVHCGLDSDYLHRPDIQPTGGRVLLCVARLAEQKGHLALLEAAAALRRHGVDFELRLVGDGPLRNIIQTRIDELDLADHVRLLGSLPQQAVRGEISACRALLLPSFAEGLPVVLMEAMALCKPVISTYIAGIPELVRPEHGWIVAAGDTSALAEAMQEALAADPAALSRMGSLGRLQVLKRHDIAVSAHLLERHIAAAADDRATRGSSSSARLESEAVADKVAQEIGRGSTRPAAE